MIFRAVITLCALIGCLISFALTERLSGQPPVSVPAGVAITIDGKVVGNFTALTFTSGNGILWTSTPSGSMLNISAGYNTATVETRSLSVQSVDHFCKSTAGVTTFACDTPSPAAWCTALAPGYPAGTWVDLWADASPNATSTAAWINVNKCGQVNIKLADGSTDPATAIVKGSMYHLVSDGTVFRMD